MLHLQHPPAPAPRPASTSAELRHIPAIRTIASQRRFVCWQAETIASGKTSKVPYSGYCISSTGRPHRASSTNARHWTSLKTAQATAEQAGMGIGLMLGNGIGGIDLDGCIDSDGTITSWALEILATVPNCYAEVSPSGAGIKIYGRAPEQDAIIVSFGAHNGIEVYARDRYFALTGQQLDSHSRTELADLTPAIAHIQTTYAEQIAQAKAKTATRPAQARQEAPGRVTRPTIEQTQAKTAGDRKRAYNASHDLLAMMQADGAEIVSRQDDGSVLLSGLPGDGSSHDVVYKLTPARSALAGAWIGYSYSTSTRLRGLRNGIDAAEYAIQMYHGGDYVAWLKAEYPLAAKTRTASYAEADARTQARASQDARQQADADRKAERAAAYRQQQAEIRERVYQAVNADETLSDRAIEVWARIYADAADHDAAYSTLSNAQLMADLGCSESTVQRAMRELAPYIRTVGQSRPIPIVRRTLIDPAVQITGVSNTAVQNTGVSSIAPENADYVNGDTPSISKSLDSRSKLIEQSEGEGGLVADLDSYESYTPTYDQAEPADWSAVLALFDAPQVEQAQEQPAQVAGDIKTPSLCSEAPQAETTPPASMLAVMAQEYLASRDLGRATVNAATGEITTRRSARHFVELVQAEQPDRWTDAEIRAAYAAEQARQQAEAKAELAAYKRRLWQMPEAELVQHIQAGLKAEIATLGRVKGQDKYQTWLYRFRLKVAGEVAKRRRITIPAPAQAERPTKAKPTKAKPTKAEQMPLFA